jgi:hypothetical protein
MLRASWQTWCRAQHCSRLTRLPSITLRTTLSATSSLAPTVCYNHLDHHRCFTSTSSGSGHGTSQKVRQTPQRIPLSLTAAKQEVERLLRDLRLGLPPIQERALKQLAILAAQENAVSDPSIRVSTKYIHLDVSL